MEFCTLEDAFPDFKTKSTARGEEKKKAKRCKGPAQTYLTAQESTDPDRPAQIKMPEVPPVNEKTGLREHTPVDAPQAEPFLDSGSEYDQLLSSLSASTVAGPTKLAKGKPPAFFGAGEDDDTEGFASFTDVIGDDPGYKLTPDFTQTFSAKGAAKAGGLPTADVNTNINWKPMTSGGAKTAFYSQVTTRPSAPVPSPVSEDNRDLLKKMDKIFARLDDLENRKSENAQTEVVLFVMSGLFILFTMDLLVRKAGSVRLIR
jgi:hypothetical protein